MKTKELFMTGIGKVLASRPKGIELVPTVIAAVFALLWALTESGYIVKGSWMAQDMESQSWTCIFKWGLLQFALFFLFYLSVCQLAVRSRLFALLVFIPLILECVFAQLVTGCYKTKYETVILSSFNANANQIGQYTDQSAVIWIISLVAPVVAYCMFYHKIWKSRPVDTRIWSALLFFSILLPFLLVKCIPATRYRLAGGFWDYSPQVCKWWVGNSQEGISPHSGYFREVADRRRFAELFLPYNRLSNWVEITWNKVLFPPPLKDSAKEDSVFAPRSDKLCVVLYVSESFRADRLPFAGYHRNTLPKTTAAYSSNIIHLPQVMSYDTLTVSCMFGILSNKEGKAGKTTRNSFQGIFKKHGFFCCVVENNCDYAPWFDSIILRPCLKGTWDRYVPYTRSDALDAPVAECMEQHPYSMIVIEDGSGHAPYGEATGTLWGNTNTDLYDEARLPTDSHFAGVLKRLEHIPAIVLFVSDHGESLGEGGRLMHGGSLNATEQRHVAAFVWYSDEYARLYPDVIQNLRDNAGIFTTQEYIYHTMPTLGSIRSQAQDVAQDMASPQSRTRESD